MIAAEVKYKKTGIDWMPEVPEHWKMWKVSRAFKIIGSGTTPQSGNLSYYNNGTINWVCTGDLNDDLVETTEHRVTKAAFESHSALKLFPKGTLLIAMYGATIGKTGILGFDACTNQACCALGGSDVLLTKFVYYWFFVNRPNIVRLSYGGGQPNISQDVIKQLRIQTPPIEEQEQIVSFLDSQSAKITRFIQTKQRFIELLKEQRQSIITHAVTKGIDENVKMKETVLGEIPEHWGVRRLKFCLGERLKYGANAAGDYYNPAWYRYIRITDFTSDGTLDESNKLSLSPEDGKDYELKDGDILLARSGATVGKSFQFKSVDRNEKCCYAGYLIKASANEDLILSDFLYNFTLTSNYENWKGSILIKATIENISAEKYANLLIPIPPIEEQRLIIEHIKTETRTLDIAISKAEREIELIKEYREAMIAEAVTGKMKL